MEKEPEIKEPGSNGDESYPEFLKGLADSGALGNGEHIAREGLQLLASQPGRQAVIHTIASVGAAMQIYKDKTLAAVTDMIYRTVFDSRDEQLTYLEYVDWCIEFEQPLDYALRYVISKPAIHGRARDELVAVMNTYNVNQRSYANRTKDKSKSGKEALS